MVSDQEILDIMLHVRSLSSKILIMEMSKSQNNCLSPDCQSILVYFFEMFGSYMNHFLLMRTNSDDNGASV